MLKTLTATSSVKKRCCLACSEMASMDLVIAQIRATEANIDVDEAIRLAAQRVG